MIMKIKTRAVTINTTRKAPELKNKDDDRLRRRRHLKLSEDCSQKGGSSFSSPYIIGRLVFFSFLLFFEVLVLRERGKRNQRFGEMSFMNTLF